MPMHKQVLSIAALLALSFAARAETQGHYGIGRTATEAEIAGWNIDIGRDGRLNHRIEVRTGVLEEECRTLMQDFFRRRRTE